MQKIKLSNGLLIPKIGLGTSSVRDEKEAIEVFKFALTNGYQMIDTAQLYQNQVFIGKAIKESKIDRSNLIVITKLWDADQGYESTKKAINKSLEELNLDYIDIYLIHTPIPNGKLNSYKTLNIESWKAMEEAYKEGKLKAIGLSNFMPEQIDNIINHCSIKPMVDEVEFHPGCTQDKLVEYCAKHDIKIIGYAPLVRYTDMLKDDLLLRLSKKYNKTTAQICLRWSIQHGVIPIPKSTHKERLLENLNVFDFELSQEDIKAINQLNYFPAYHFDPYKENQRIIKK